MTVLANQPSRFQLGTVSEDGVELVVREVKSISADLRESHEILSAIEEPLTANAGLAAVGYGLYGLGFLLNESESRRFQAEGDDVASERILKPFISAKDIVNRPLRRFVIDFGLRSEHEARRWPVHLQHVEDRVRPMRESMPDRWRRENWWLLGRPNRDLRDATVDLDFFILTPRTAKHRMFVRRDTSFLPDEGVVVIAVDSLFLLGVLSSAIHMAWALRAGGTLEDRPRYNKSLCFDPFAFPDSESTSRRAVADAARRLESHRAEALTRGEEVTMTVMYNIVDKLRAGDLLTPKEKAIHEIAACGVLKDLHDDLDALVADAYGWPWPMEREEILKRLVALHDERIAEEKAGRIRWLRPEYQIPRFAPKSAPSELALTAAPKTSAGVMRRAIPWPQSSVEQLTAVKAAAAQVGARPEDVLGVFSGANEAHLRRHLETLAMMGEV